MKFNEATIKGTVTAEKLTEALNQVQARCKERTVTAEQILTAFDSITKGLNIPKKSMNGIKVTFDLNAQRFPNAYKYQPMSTIVSAEFKNGKWTNVCIERWHTHTPNRKFIITHTEESKAALIKRFSEFC